MSQTTLIEDMPGERWFQDSRGFDSLYYEGNTGGLIAGVAGTVYRLEQGSSDDNGSPIPLKWFSRYFDQGERNHTKVYQDLVIEHNCRGAELTVKLAFNNGADFFELGTIGGDHPWRTQSVLMVNGQNGFEAKNVAIWIEGNANINSTPPVEIYAIKLHYYLKAREAKTWDSGELDFRTQHVKRIRALELDLANPDVALTVAIQTDMPGNAFAVRQTYNIGAASRRKWQIPVPDYIEGRSYRIVVYNPQLNTTENTFQLFGARAWIQAYGTYMEAYEGAAGQIYDSFQVTPTPGYVSQSKCLELDVDTDGAVTAELLSDLPGNDITAKSSVAVNTETTTTGRRMVRIPLEPYPEGRLYQVKLSGDQALRLYGARLEVKPVGVYVEAYESTGGRTWDSDTLDLGTPKVKEIREVQLDVDTDGALTLNLWTELPGLGMAIRHTATVNTEATTAGRRMVNLPIATPIEGRLVRLELKGSSAFRLYGAWIFARAIGYYVESYQASGGHYWDSSVLDLGTQNVKRILQLEIEAHGDSALTVETYTTNAAGDVALRATDTIPASSTRRAHIVPLTDVYGRLLRVKISGDAAFRIYQVRAYIKAIGVYLNGGSEEIFPVEPEQDLGSERVKLFKEIEAVYSADAAAELRFHTELPSGLHLVRTIALPLSTTTTTAKLRLPHSTKGRLVKIEVVPGSGDVRLYDLRVWTRLLGAGPQQWAWLTLPIPRTPDNYSWSEIYVPPTPPAWEWGEVWVPETPLGWRWFDLPCEKTPELPAWVNLPIKY